MGYSVGQIHSAVAADAISKQQWLSLAQGMVAAIAMNICIQIHIIFFV
jgi:hypothetical protein